MQTLNFLTPASRVKFEYLRDMLNFLLRKRRHSLEWCACESLEPFQRESEGVFLHYYSKQERMAVLKKFISEYYFQEADDWKKTIREELQEIQVINKFRNTLYKYVLIFQRNGVLENIFDTSNLKLSLERYIREVLAYHEQPMPCICTLPSLCLVIANPEFMKEPLKEPYSDYKNTKEFVGSFEELSRFFRKRIVVPRKEG